jgi:hypothetical protein
MKTVQVCHLVQSINRNSKSESTHLDCIHSALRVHFRPQTNLTTFTDFTQNFETIGIHPGMRSLKMQFESSWIVLTLLDRRAHSPTDCCNNCDKCLLIKYPPPEPHDPRLTAYAADFYFPLQLPEPIASSSTLPSQRPHSDSITSNMTDASSLDPPLVAVAIPLTQAPFVPLRFRCSLPTEFRSALEERLEEWRTNYTKKRGRSLISAKVIFPDKQLKKLVDYGGDFLRVDTITPELILRVTPWDLASNDEVQEIAQIITRWCHEVGPQITPSQAKKKARASKPAPTAVPTHVKKKKPIPQPSFSPRRARIPSTPHPDSQTNGMFLHFVGIIYIVIYLLYCS